MINWPKIHEKRTFSPATPALALLSFLYGLGSRLRFIAYGRIKRRSLPGFVVSVGNLTAGGTGKTPVTGMLADWALNEGYRVAILSRGYGGLNKNRVLEVSDGNTISAGPADAGDEPYMLAKKFRGVPVIISRERYPAGLYAHKKFKTDFFILDDGFQHIALKRDLDLVLMDGRSPFGNGHLLPWGPLREPAGHLERAHAFIITRSGPGKTSDNLIRVLKESHPHKPVFRSNHIPDRVIFPGRNESYGPDFLKGKRVLAFAGIARPEAFRETLIGLGAEPVVFRAFRDHFPFKRQDISSLAAQMAGSGADCLLTTEKDCMRMENFLPDFHKFAYLTIKFTFLSEREEFFRMVKERAERLIV